MFWNAHLFAFYFLYEIDICTSRIVIFDDDVKQLNSINKVQIYLFHNFFVILPENVCTI